MELEITDLEYQEKQAGIDELAKKACYQRLYKRASDGRTAPRWHSVSEDCGMSASYKIENSTALSSNYV
jgi:hypothetical protein